MSEYKPLTCLPVLPLRGLVVFPGVVTHFDVGRLKSAKSVEEAMRADQRIFLTAQKDLSVDDPKKNDLYAVGTVAIVKQILRMPGDNMRILVEGKFRAELVDCIQSEPYLFARVEEIEEPSYNASLPRVQALLRQALSDGEPDGLVMPFVENYDGLAPLLAQEIRSDLIDRIVELGEASRQRKERNVRPRALSTLTEREFEIVRLMAQRLSNREIAERLFLTEGSVKQYVNRIYAKLFIEGDTRTKRKRLLEMTQH